MKKILKLISLPCIIAVLFTACDKEADLPYYKAGQAPELSASSLTVAPAPADSNNLALTLSWTFPNHGTDTANIKYVIEIDSTGKNFSNPATRTVMGSLSTQYIAKQLNAILLAKNYAFNVPVDMDVRVTSSYANNNERLTSNILKIRMTPYKIPPKVVLPAGGRLFIVGDATTFGWSNDAAPAFPAAREFARIDETTWAGVMYLDGSGAWKILQTQGNWDSQFHMVNGGTATDGSFIQENADPGFPSPAAAGWYTITLDFQTGKYKVQPFEWNELPQQLYITGDATPSSWTENPPASQQFTRLNSSEYQITMSFVPGKVYKFLMTLGQWQPQFGSHRDHVTTNTAFTGILGANYGSSNDPEPVNTPATAGSYKVKVNFATKKYLVSL